MFLDPSLFERFCQILLKPWLCTWWVRLHQMKVELLLAVQCSTIDITLKKSGNFRRDTRWKVFSSQLVRKGSTVRYYDGSLVYDSLSPVAIASRYMTRA